MSYEGESCNFNGSDVLDQGTNDIDRGPVASNATTLFFFFFLSVKSLFT